MLVLSRKESEKIMLGDEIVLTIVRVSGDRVRLGIQAPTDMLILRHELDSNEAPASHGNDKINQPQQKVA
ncbi:MAG: carbon storage regulator [Planctomycetota bacterium]